MPAPGGAQRPISPRSTVLKAISYTSDSPAGSRIHSPPHIFEWTCSDSAISACFQGWLQHFHTSPCPPSTWGRALLPLYHEICFVKPDDLYVDRDKSTWCKRKSPLSPYKKYAKEAISPKAIIPPQSSVTTQVYNMSGNMP